LRPSDVGLVEGPRRRAQGLRREEVAQLAGMSTDYYARRALARVTTGSSYSGSPPSASNALVNVAPHRQRECSTSWRS
jgi:hypothetical protein